MLNVLDVVVVMINMIKTQIPNYRTPTGVIDHQTCTDNFLYRPKHYLGYYLGYTDAL